MDPRRYELDTSTSAGGRRGQQRPSGRGKRSRPPASLSAAHRQKTHFRCATDDAYSLSRLMLSQREPPREGTKLLGEVRAWNEAKVADWLVTVNSATYTAVFIENHITGSTLLDCDQTALRELGISKVGDRVRLSVAIKNLRTKCYAVPRTASVTESYSSESLAQPLLRSPTTPTSYSSGKTTSNYTTAPPTRSPFPVQTSPVRVRTASSDKVDSPLRSANGMISLFSNCVKFIGEEGQTRIVNIGDCSEAWQILEKALKKFGWLEAITNDPYHRVENYCVFITADVGAARQLSDEELFQICQDPHRPERERLILKRKDASPSILEFRQAQKIAKEQQALLKDAALANNITKMRKIGGFFGETPTHIRAGSGSNIPSPLPSPMGLQHPKGPKARIKEFFGGRPPSELISSNLSEYFPEASNLVLEKTVRNSIRRSQRMSVATRTASGRRYSNASAFSVASFKSVTPSVTVGDAWISATSTRKSRPASLHRAASIRSNSDTIGSKRSRKSKYEPSVRSMRSLRSQTGKSVNSDATYREEDHSPSASDDEDGVLEIYEAEFGSEPEYELPNYLKEKLALTRDDDEDSTIQLGRRISLATGEAQISADNVVASINAEDTGPSSWIKGTLIGQGSFGSVVLGMNQLTGELMAVKQVDLPKTSHDRDLASRKHAMLDALQREISLLRDMQHDNIVQYLGSNSDDTHLNIFLEYVPGGSVTEMLTKYGAFKEPLVRQFVRQILTGLNYLHEREIIHRDIKGGNILVDNKGVIKISDFGISKKVDSKMLSMQEIPQKSENKASLQGSVFWMAPEVVKQSLYTRKADIWSLGCLIVEMFTGQHPYPEFNQMQAIFKIGGADSAPDIPEGISADGINFLSQTFELDYSKRPSAAELLAHSFCHASVA